jgi:hypothetical protein
MNFSWGKRLYTEWCSRKERSGIVWLLAGVWQLKEVRGNTHTERCPTHLGEEDVIHISLHCLETINWGMEFLNDMWLSMNKEIAYVKVLRCTNKDQMTNLGRYLDKSRYKWFNRTKVIVNIISIK